MRLLFIALFDKETILGSKDIIKAVVLITGSISAIVVKLIFENRQKKLTFWAAFASFFISITVCYLVHPLILYYFQEQFHLALIGGTALLSDKIVIYVYTKAEDLFKVLINKIWGTVSK